MPSGIRSPKHVLYEDSKLLQLDLNSHIPEKEKNFNKQFASSLCVLISRFSLKGLQ